MWKTIVTPTTCYYCLFMNGRILSVDDPELAKIPVHPNCGCSIEAVRATQAGMATNDYRMHQDECGMKQISIMRMVTEITAVCCILMMGWYL